MYIAHEVHVNVQEKKNLKHNYSPRPKSGAVQIKLSHPELNVQDQKVNNAVCTCLRKPIVPFPPNHQAGVTPPAIKILIHRSSVDSGTERLKRKIMLDNMMTSMHAMTMTCKLIIIVKTTTL